jgi:hypothetical protein
MADSRFAPRRLQLIYSYCTTRVHGLRYDIVKYVYIILMLLVSTTYDSTAILADAKRVICIAQSTLQWTIPQLTKILISTSLDKIPS